MTWGAANSSFSTKLPCSYKTQRHAEWTMRLKTCGRPARCEMRLDYEEVKSSNFLTSNCLLFPFKSQKIYFKENMLQIFLSSHKGLQVYNLRGLKSQRVCFELPFYLCSKNKSSREHQYASLFPVYGKLMNFHDFSITFPSCYCWNLFFKIMFIQASSLMNH